MGHRISKETMNPRTGLTPTENRLLKKTWRSLCDNNRDYGVLILQGFFAKQPDAIHLFQHFRGKPAKSLPTDMSFRIHACAVGYQLTSMVENCDDVELLEALIRKNAQVHKPHLGVTPMHFRIMTKAIMDVLHAKVSKLMTPDAVVAWEKLFTVAAHKPILSKEAEADVLQRTGKTLETMGLLLQGENVVLTGEVQEDLIEALRVASNNGEVLSEDGSEYILPIIIRGVAQGVIAHVVHKKLNKG
ncbi:hypothetical protein HPB52_013232 [Rhipicephalus sanguineus]|uniref:Globin domain-containing protein n=1 Tax=Rhipicephalus sanguineus TaxID=34632 RepID=A0A9D4T0A1_RHISA|nr:hypothetical protein HPB52_013232 [Rhipicephalus sanguineus]